MARQPFKGVRGSYPVSHKNVNKYGGNTSSIIVEYDGEVLVLDAGTGIINLGNELNENSRNRKIVNIFLTHLHIDHIQGLPFFDFVVGLAFILMVDSLLAKIIQGHPKFLCFKFVPLFSGEVESGQT